MVVVARVKKIRARPRENSLAKKWLTSMNEVEAKTTKGGRFSLAEPTEELACDFQCDLESGGEQMTTKMKEGNKSGMNDEKETMESMEVLGNGVDEEKEPEEEMNVGSDGQDVSKEQEGAAGEKDDKSDDKWKLIQGGGVKNPYWKLTKQTEEKGQEDDTSSEVDPKEVRNKKAEEALAK